MPQDPQPNTILAATEPATSRWISEAAARHSGTLLVYLGILGLGNLLGAKVDARAYAVLVAWILLNLVIAPWAARPLDFATRLRRYALTLVVDVLFLGAVYYFIDAAQWLGAVFFIHSAIVASATLPRKWATALAALIVAVFGVLVWVAVAGTSAVQSPVGLPPVTGNYAWALGSTAAAIGLIVVLMMLQLRLVETIRGAEQRFRLIVSALDLGFYTIDTDGRLTAIYGRWAEEQIASGRARVGSPAIDLVPPESADLHRDANLRAIAGEDVTFHWSVVPADGAPERFYRAHLAPMRDAGGVIVGVAGVWTDETAAMAAERERETLRARLVDAERIESLGKLVSGVAHELNNPLAAILNFTEDLLADQRTGDERMALEVIQAQALRSRTIVRDLLTFVRKGDRRLLKAETPGPIVETLVRAVRPGMATQGVLFTATIDDPNVPLLLDRAGFEQVITNLLTNAAQSAGAGGAVRLAAHVSGESYEVSVEDNGAGIAEEHFGRIFEPFFTTKATGQGVGLGLSVSLGIVQAHDGVLLAENRGSAAGGGARFTMRIPLSSTHEARPPLPTLQVPMPPRSASLLIIDDEEPIRRALRRYFERRGWVVEEATDGADAVLKLERTDAGAIFDVVLCDLKMPGISGQELYMRLVRDGRGLARKFIFATGDSGAPDVAEFLREVGVPVLEKPFELGVLEQVVLRVRAESGE